MRRLAPAALLGLLLAAPPLQAEPVELFGRTVQLSLPLGYCILDSAQPNEKMLVDAITTGNQGSNHLVAYFAPCNDLTAYRAGAIQVLSEYGILFVPLVNGAFQPQTASRAQALAEIAAAVPPVDQAALDQIERDASSATGVTISGVQFLGMVGQDPNAIYAGMLMDLSNAEAKITAAGVVAITVLGDVALTANLYRPYRSNADIVALTNELMPYMAALTTANP